ncbi:MAG: hypothetical protein DBY37_12055 [Desulfovibrionaceae bacterium]|nr:MAG: hypothetical protein DBY37_12055 [Desulfovibrionaceae bacterium]
MNFLRAAESRSSRGARFRLAGVQQALKKYGIASAGRQQKIGTARSLPVAAHRGYGNWEQSAASGSRSPLAVQVV